MNEPEKPDNPEPPSLQVFATPTSVWLIEVPSTGYRWFTTEPDRAAYWRDRKDAVVTTYTRS